MQRNDPMTAGQPSRTGKVWKTALYIRLSCEDEGEKAESCSVTSQREILRAYAAQHPDLRPVDVYVDDGWSGTNFDRPGFQRMMSDIYAGRVDCVLVKDLSRFGRNAVDAGRYLDDVFTRLQVRFIAVNNCLDTLSSDMNAATRCIAVGVQNVINESVAATTSVNVRGTLNAARAKGEFIGSFPSYGYVKDPADRHHLLVDPEAAAVVRQIFAWFIGGKSVLGIARALNERGVPNPSRYKQLRGYRYRHPAGQRADGLWPDSSVRRILTNEMYLGNMVQGVNTTISYKIRKCRALPREDWIVVEGTHEPIIDRRTFDLAQSLFRRGVRQAPQRREADLFAGLVRCADCGRVMHKKTNVHPYGTYAYYRCATARRMAPGECTNHTIRIDRLELAVRVTLQKMVDTAVEMDALLARVNANPRRAAESDMLQRALETQRQERERAVRLRADLYPDWKRGVLSEEEYLQLKAGVGEKIAALDEKLRALEQTLADRRSGCAAQSEALAAFRRCGRIETLTRAMLTELVEEIRVFEGGKIEVRFRFRDAFREILDYLALNRTPFEPGA